jgi:hypothetical protein
VVDVQVREDDDVDGIALDSVLRERAWQQPLAFRRPEVPQAGGPDTRIHEHGDVRRADEVDRDRQPPATVWLP